MRKEKPQPPKPRRGYMAYNFYGQPILRTFATNRTDAWWELLHKFLGQGWTKERAKESGYRCHPVTITPEVK